ncbi:MAG: hypothetical protein R2752_22665 [Vicinamibacterales bacterium]
MRRITILTLLVSLAAGPSIAAAQSSHPVSAAFRAGIVPSDAGTSAAVGGLVMLELSDRVAIEGEATYVTQARWSSTVTLGASALVAVSGHWSDAVVPFVGGGLAYHRATVTLADPRLLGAIPAGVQAGDRFCAGPGGGGPLGMGPGSGMGVGGNACVAGAGLGLWGAGDLPDFYARRLGVLVVPGDRRWPDRTFGDPAITASFGVRFNTDGRFFVQPEARLWIVLADGRSRTSGLFGATAGYRF